MKPVVALVGRPNVGKSTLFNVLTRSRAAIVADAPGVTRDRQYGNGVVGDRPYFVVDTGGLVSGRLGSVTGTMDAQTRLAMEEADSIVFVVDGREGPTVEDRDIAERLRRLGKSIVVAVNKAEGRDAESTIAEFHSLGLGRPLAISAAHDQGIIPLMSVTLRELPVVESDEVPDDYPVVAIAGRPNVGKSTLLNALLGEERVVVADQPGTTRDSIRVPVFHGKREYVFIDTAGVRRRGRITESVEKVSVVKSLQAVDAANVVVLVLDARQEVSDQDVDLAGYIVSQGRSIVLAVNKWDGLDSSRRDWIKRELDRKLTFLSFASPHFISAREKTGLGKLFPAIDTAFASARMDFPTARLNRILEKAVQATPPPIVRGRRIKLKFAHQSGHNPPRITIHGASTTGVPEAYRRYLSNAFRNAFKLEGTPVRIEFEQAENPYVEARKKVRLTPKQHAVQQRERRIRKKRNPRQSG